MRTRTRTHAASRQAAEASGHQPFSERDEAQTPCLHPARPREFRDVHFSTYFTNRCRHFLGSPAIKNSSDEIIHTCNSDLQRLNWGLELTAEVVERAEQRHSQRRHGSHQGPQNPGAASICGENKRSVQSRPRSQAETLIQVETSLCSFTARRAAADGLAGGLGGGGGGRWGWWDHWEIREQTDTRVHCHMIDPHLRGHSLTPNASPSTFSYIVIAPPPPPHPEISFV